MAVKQRFMLDTNAVRVLLEHRSLLLDQWFAEERCSLSAIVAAEIRIGLARQTLSEHLAALVADLLDVLPIEPFDTHVSVTYGHLRAELQRLGISLAAVGLLIAAHALALPRSLVSLDQAFTHFPGLECIAVV